MKKLMFAGICICAISLLSCGSAQLTEGGKNVQYVTKQEAPKNYTKLGEVSVGETSFASSVAGAITMLRNETAKMGGDFLVIDVLEKFYGDNGTFWYGANGRAYKSK